MKKNKSLLAKEWVIKGQHDIENARLLYRDEGYTDTIAFLIQQTIEKYLKGYLIYHDWKLKKTHDLEYLLNEAVKTNVAFEEFTLICRKATKYYIDSRYPLGMPIEYTRKEIKESIGEAEKLIEKIFKEID